MKSKLKPIPPVNVSIKPAQRRGGRIAWSFATGLLACIGAQAAIGPGNGSITTPNNAPYVGNGELFLSVFDATAKISYTLDLGLDLNGFFISGQQDRGGQLFFPVADAQWIDFLSRPTVSASNLRWSVLGFDITGGLAAGVNGIRLFQTIQQGDEAKVSKILNSALATGISATQAGTFFNAVNATGTHGTASIAADYTVNGSSVNADPDPGNSYYGSNSPGLSSTLTGSAGYDVSNAVGQSSWFYMVTRSSNSNSVPVSVDEFDNGTVTTGGHDGYWGFTKVGADVDSPYKGQYLLSYTLESALPTALTAAGQLRANFLDYAAGLQSRPLLNSGPGEFAGYQITSLVVPSAVPEPATWGLFGLGLLGLALQARRRRG